MLRCVCMQIAMKKGHISEPSGVKTCQPSSSSLPLPYYLTMVKLLLRRRTLPLAISKGSSQWEISATTAHRRWNGKLSKIRRAAESTKLGEVTCQLMPSGTTLCDLECQRFIC